uniref:Uncharacterized protein n=1 Tax=Oryza glumipatula TaxID=40148 RepID=A0A0D9Z5F6_9ORYZ
MRRLSCGFVPLDDGFIYAIVWGYGQSVLEYRYMSALYILRSIKIIDTSQSLGKKIIYCGGGDGGFIVSPLSSFDDPVHRQAISGRETRGRGAHGGRSRKKTENGLLKKPRAVVAAVCCGGGDGGFIVSPLSSFDDPVHRQAISGRETRGRGAHGGRSMKKTENISGGKYSL